MKIVIDASLLVAMTTDPARAPAVRAQLTKWRKAGDTLHAPSLIRYEVANGLTRAVVAGTITADEVTTAWRRIRRVPVTLHQLDDVPAAVATALQLKRQNAYDAAYVTLAQTLETDVPTDGGPLRRHVGAGPHPSRGARRRCDQSGG